MSFGDVLGSGTVTASFILSIILAVVILLLIVLLCFSAQRLGSISDRSSAEERAKGTLQEEEKLQKEKLKQERKKIRAAMIFHAAQHMEDQAQLEAAMAKKYNDNPEDFKLRKDGKVRYASIFLPEKEALLEDTDLTSSQAKDQDNLPLLTSRSRMGSRSRASKSRTGTHSRTSPGPLPTKDGVPPLRYNSSSSNASPTPSSVSSYNTPSTAGSASSTTPLLPSGSHPSKNSRSRPLPQDQNQIFTYDEEDAPK